MNNTLELEQKPILKLIAIYSIPAVIGMLVNAIYNIVDRIFIGYFAGENALAGLTITFPIMLLTFAFAGLIGAGGAPLISIRFGEKNDKEASHIFGNMMTVSLIIAAVCTIMGLIFLEKLLMLFGADQETLPYAYDYMKIILLGVPFHVASFTLSNTVRTEGKPNLAMIAMIISALVNIVLDYIFIGPLDMGVKGAALATILGQLVGLIVLGNYYLSGRSIFKFKKSHFIPDLKIIMSIASLGSISFLSTIGISVATAFLNLSLAKYGGNPAIASMGAINSLFTMFIMPMFGIQQGIQPIIGYNHGAGIKKRVNKAMVYGIIISMIFSTLVFLMLEIAPKTFISLFIDKDSDTIPMAVEGLRLFVLALPIIGINFIGVSYFQATAQAKIAIFLGASRQFLILIPAIFILPHFLGITGVWLATPLSDFLSVAMTIVYLYIALRKKVNAKISIGDGELDSVS